MDVTATKADFASARPSLGNLLLGINWMRVDEGRMCRALHAVKLNACTVVVKWQQCPPYGPGSELLVRRSCRGRGKGNRWDRKMQNVCICIPGKYFRSNIRYLFRQGGRTVFLSSFPLYKMHLNATRAREERGVRCPLLRRAYG